MIALATKARAATAGRTAAAVRAAMRIMRGNTVLRGRRGVHAAAGSVKSTIAHAVRAATEKTIKRGAASAAPRRRAYPPRRCKNYGHEKVAGSLQAFRR